MAAYKTLSKDELISLKERLQGQYESYQAKNMNLDMSRGKPGTDQLNMVSPILDVLTSEDDFKSENGVELRNYGDLLGILEARKLFAEMLEVDYNKVIVGNNSSLNMMYDIIARAMIFGVLESDKPWSAYDRPKFLCPSPGYDRHFAICQHFNIEMITIAMTAEGPDMDMVEKLVQNDESIKGMWNVPKYSNPQGYTYSDETVKRLANLKPAAKDFRLFWDNAYCVHHLSDTPDTLLNIIDECEKAGNANMVFEFASTSKVTFPGAGIGAMAASEENIAFIAKQMFYQTIGPDKINQQRHVLYLKNMDTITALMKKQAEILKPKFDVVLNTLSNELGDLEIATWTNPNGGYFVSLDTMDGCAKQVVQLCKEAGLTLTPAGVTYPYGNDPADKNIRIAPTFPPVEELQTAMDLFCVCLQLASVESLLK